MPATLEILPASRPAAIRSRGNVESAHGIAVLTVCAPSSPATVRRELKAALQRAAQDYNEPLCLAFLALLSLHAKHTQRTRADRATLHKVIGNPTG